MSDHNIEDELVKIKRELAIKNRELEEAQRFVQRILDTMPNIVYIYDLAEQRNTYSNREIAESLGYSPKQVQDMGTKVFTILVHPDDLPLLSERMERFETARDGDIVESNYRMKDAKGEWRWLHSRDTVLSRNATGAPKQILGVAQDITERKLFEEKLLIQSTRDALTGLYNRFFFEEEAARLEHSRRFPVSIVMIDLNDLKETNDQMGHAAGDDLIKRTAAVLQSAFRSEDIVARIGGDEFAAILPNTDAAAIVAVLKRIRSARAAHNAAGNFPPIDFSMGAATAEKGAPLSGALKRADARMYREKSASHRKHAHPPAIHSKSATGLQAGK